MSERLSDEFENLLEKVIDGLALDDERARFAALLKTDETARTRYAELMRIHALLRCRLAQTDAQNGKPAPQSYHAKRFAWWKVAVAAILVLALGAAMWKSEAIWRTEDGGQSSAAEAGPCSRPSGSVTPTLVRLEEAVGVKGLEPADAKVGTWCRASELKLVSGQVRFRLASKTEVTLLGPAEIALRDGMNATLTSGRMLANVPPSASGFTVHVPGLLVRDLGTVFGAMTLGGVSDVFVFKGRVQVTDGKGEDVGLREAGQGAHAHLGCVATTAANWSEAERLFASVAGNRALKNPAETLRVLEKIGEQWQTRHTPGLESPAAPTAKTGNKKTVEKKKDPYNKKVWFRPTEDLQRENLHAVRSKTLMDVLSAGREGAVSEPLQVESSPCSDNRRWATAFTNEIPLRWDWAASAMRAKLEMIGMNASFVTNFTRETAAYVWKPFGSGIPASEDVYDLRLTFYTADDAVAGTLTSRLAVVAGAFGRTVVNPNPLSKGWCLAQGNKVIPYDAYWSEETARETKGPVLVTTTKGTTHTRRLSETSGYYGCKFAHANSELDTVGLVLVFEEAAKEWRTTVSRRKDETDTRER
jgi:ferric-dicitrate binding protein FerR (iron transport regulator)